MQHPSADGGAIDAVAAGEGADASMRRVAHLGRLEKRPTSRAELRLYDLRTIAPSFSRPASTNRCESDSVGRAGEMIAVIENGQGNSQLGVGYLGTICPFSWDLDA